MLYTHSTDVDFKLNTKGDGLWSIAEKEVSIKSLVVHYYDDMEFGELRVLFNVNDWDILEDGLIYTDGGFERELKKVLKDEYEFSNNELRQLGYSEQGMQGNDYVSMDIGARFLEKFLRVFKES